MAIASDATARGADPATPRAGARFRVRGLVQGVGFRPNVWRLAQGLGLSGEVGNDAEGVWICAAGPPEALAKLEQGLRSRVPPLARIDAIERLPWRPPPDIPAGFRIARSRDGAIHTGVVPDAAVCSDCAGEIRDPADRRHGYAFTNCTHCGPRLSILRSIPYDRAHTSMAAFPMCPACRREYEDPGNRRFHAQPNACPQCGPRLWLEPNRSAELPLPAAAASDPIGACADMIRDGAIVAVKGLGGIHLVVDAGNEAAVQRLRQRKRRPHKPMALMATDLDSIRRHAEVSGREAEALTAASAAIVLLRRHGDGIAPSVAPAQSVLGFMLPYSPLHLLLMERLPGPVVMTSGNRSQEPQCIDNEDARERLGDIADALLLHDRDIVNRVDDSVQRVVGGRLLTLRRGRGLAPAPMTLPPGFEASPPLLALGGELKNSFCLLRDGQAVLSQHMGDLENAVANAAWQESLQRYLQLFEHRPRALAIDGHPEYLPSKHGRAWAERQGLPLYEVQHHHAHIAACMAENGLPADSGPVIGIAFDGLGWGDDGSLWGGEILLADYRCSRRVAHLRPVPMPGGAQAIRQPWRMAFAQLRQRADFEALRSRHRSLAFFRALEGRPVATLEGMLRSGFHCPPTSSCGRLFDAVAALCGLCSEISHEGQAAMALEALVDDAALASASPYPFHIHEDAAAGSAALPQIDPAPMWPLLLADLEAGTPRSLIAAGFHLGLAAAVAAVLERLPLPAAAGRSRPPVVLSGGVFQNAVFTGLLCQRLERDGWRVLRHADVPAGDGGLALGQAVVAAARYAGGYSVAASCPITDEALP